MFIIFSNAKSVLGTELVLGYDSIKTGKNGRKKPAKKEVSFEVV